MTGRFSASVTRRSVLQGMGVGTLGLAGAALLGCGGGDEGSARNTGAQATSVAGSTRGAGLPLVAPKVQGKIKPGGTWTTSQSSTGKQHDAHTALGGNIYHVIGDKGLEPDAVTNKILPHMFTSWEVADPSGTTLVFKVHPKLFIHNMPPYNGRQFTAEDAAWNLMRIGGLFAEQEKIPLSSFQRASMVANITKAEAIDPLTVKVSLSRPNNAFFNGLMENRVPFMPKEVVDIGFKDPLKLAGTGPFQVDEWVDNQKDTYKKNPRYAEFRTSEPYFDRFDRIVIPDSAGEQAAFISGQISQISTPSPENINTIRKAKPDANLYATVDQNWQHIRMSVEYPPFKDFRVRKALHLTGDYKSMAEGYYGDGWAYQASLNPMFPEAWGPDKVKSLPGYNPDTKEKDRAEAHKLLTAAGYPNGKGIDFEIIYQQPSEVNRENATRFHNQITTAFPEMKFRLKPMPDSATFSVPQAEGKFQMLAYTITCVPDAVLEFTSQYHSKGSRNYGHFNEPALDSLMDKAIVELNMAERTKMLEEAQQKFMDEWMPMYVLYAQPRKVMIQGNVGGFDTTWGIAHGYMSNTKVCRWYYVEK
jgi:peptide/nickel transport system substrate-binding protein